MTNKAVSDYTEKTDVDGEELLEVIDLRESLVANQNKKMTTDTLLGSMVTHGDGVVVFNDEVVYI